MTNTEKTDRTIQKTPNYTPVRSDYQLPPITDDTINETIELLKSFRDKKIISLVKTTPITKVAKQFKLSRESIYNILEKGGENL